MRRDRNPSVGTTVTGGIVSLRINARFGRRDEAPHGTRQTLTPPAAEQLGDLDLRRGRRHAARRRASRAMLLEHAQPPAVPSRPPRACTGGLLAKMLTDVPGLQRYFKQGWVTYSNEAKTAAARRARRTLIERTARVSEPVVDGDGGGRRTRAGSRSMPSRSPASPAPTAGRREKPVGTVCIALAARGRHRPSAPSTSPATAK